MLRTTTVVLLILMVLSAGYLRAPALSMVAPYTETNRPAMDRFADAMSAFEAERYAEAYGQFLSLADLGLARAQAMLGVCHLHGRGVDPSATEAAVWFQRAALAGYTPAQVALADLYMSGQGVSRDLVLAYRWLLVAGPRAESDMAVGIQQRLAAVGRRLSADDIAQARNWAQSWRPNRPLTP